jgi:hypothetical protein
MACAVLILAESAKRGYRNWGRKKSPGPMEKSGGTKEMDLPEFGCC